MIRACIAVLLALSVSTSISAQTRTMVVYLPSTPTESASRVAAGVTQLAVYLSDRTGMRVEVKAFRRAEDATAYLTASPGEPALIITDQAFLLDLPQGFDVVPSFRFVRAGRETGRKVVVVRSNDRATSLAGLRGRALATAAGASGGSTTYISRVVFGGEIDSARWFSRIIHEPDDFTAVTNVMFGRVDAALVSDDNPLLIANLGKTLREVFSSRPVSLPIVAVRSSLSDTQRTALEQALTSLQRPAGDSQAILAGLAIERLQRIPEGSAGLERTGLLRLPSGATRALEIALPPVTIDMPRLAPLAPDQLPYFLGVQLLDLPIPLPPLEAGGKGGTGGSGSE
jgi:ABC-type phosphate/phosphonate transport system substrate-binding protein